MSDVIVIGAGLAGLTAALRLAQGGHSVRLVTKGSGGLRLSQGSIDLLGYHDGKRVERPLETIAELPAEHPYANIGVQLVAEAAGWLSEQLGPELLIGQAQTNVVLPTAVGAWRPTALIQPSMAAAIDAASYAVVGVRQLKDFQADLIAGNLGAPAAWIDLPARPGEADPSGLTYARALDDTRFASQFAQAVASAAPAADVILLPAVLGTRPGGWRAIAEQIGRPIAEVALVPPSVPGIRLDETLLAAAKAAGVRLIIGSRITGYELADGRVSSLTLAAAGAPRQLKADYIVYAPGGFASGAVSVDSHGTVAEVVFGLPLSATDANQLIGPDFWAPQPLFSVGVHTDASGRVVDAAGELFANNLYVAGDIIAGAQRWTEKSGDGIALASAYRAAAAIMEGQS